MIKNIDMGKLSRWAQFNHKGPYKEKAGGSKIGEGDVTTEYRDWRGHEAWNASSF